jgi:hypothetical protein
LTCGFVRSNFCLAIAPPDVSYDPCAAETISPAIDSGTSS